MKCKNPIGMRKGQVDYIAAGFTHLSRTGLYNGPDRLSGTRHAIERVDFPGRYGYGGSGSRQLTEPRSSPRSASSGGVSGLA